MTFTREEISQMAVDMNDDWQNDNARGDCNVMMLVGEKTLRKVLTWFGKTYEEYETADWWIDFYAHIDPKLRHVTEIYVHMDVNYNNDEWEQPSELDLHLTNHPEMREIYLQLEKTGGEEFTEFIKECIVDLNSVEERRGLMEKNILCGFVWCHGHKDFSAWEIDITPQDQEAIEQILKKYDMYGTSERSVYDVKFSDVFHVEY